MKIKAIVFLILVSLLIFLINYKNIDNEIYYVNIDSTNNLNYNKNIEKYLKERKKLEKSVNQFSKQDYRTTDLIKDIKENKKEQNQTIQNALIKADILTIYIGINDINYKIENTNKEELYNYTDQVLDDIDELLMLIRKYCKEKIYVIGYKNEQGISYNEYFNYTNKRLNEICKEYDIKYIEINNQEIDETVTKTIIKNIY